MTASIPKETREGLVYEWETYDRHYTLNSTRFTKRQLHPNEYKY